jgi:hypothetical protein
VNVVTQLTGLAGSSFAKRTFMGARALSFVATAKGAVAAVLLVVGGTATVNTVREELAQQAEQHAAAAVTKAAAPLSVTVVRTRTETTLKASLAKYERAADDLRKVSLRSAARTDELVADTKQKLQTRYEAGLALVDSLLAVPLVAADSPPSDSVLLVLDALLQIITDDLHSIVVSATYVASGRDAPAAEPTSASAATRPAGSTSTLRTDAEFRMQTALAANVRVLNGLRPADGSANATVERLIADTTQKVQARYDEGLGLLRVLTPPDGSDAPMSRWSAVNTLVQLITNDLSTITQRAVRSLLPSPTPSPQPQRFFVPLSIRTPTPAPRTPTPAPRTASPSPHTATPRTPSPSPRTATPTARPSAPATPTPTH